MIFKNALFIILLISGIFIAGCTSSTTNISNHSVPIVSIPTIKLVKSSSIDDTWQVTNIPGGQMNIYIPPRWQTVTKYSISNSVEYPSLASYSPDQTSVIYAISGINCGTNSMKNEFNQGYIDDDMLQRLITQYIPDKNVSIDSTYYVISGHPARKIEWNTEWHTIDHSENYYVYHIGAHNEAYIIVQNNDSLALVRTEIARLASDKDRIEGKESLESVNG